MLAGWLQKDDKWAAHANPKAKRDTKKEDLVRPADLAATAWRPAGPSCDVCMLRLARFGGCRTGEASRGSQSVVCAAPACPVVCLRCACCAVQERQREEAAKKKAEAKKLAAEEEAAMAAAAAKKKAAKPAAPKVRWWAGSPPGCCCCCCLLSAVCAGGCSCCLCRPSLGTLIAVACSAAAW